jgi:hypothetical protein
MDDQSAVLTNFGARLSGPESQARRSAIAGNALSLGFGYVKGRRKFRKRDYCESLSLDVRGRAMTSLSPARDISRTRLCSFSLPGTEIESFWVL